MVVLLFLSFAACTALLSAGEKVKQTPSDMLKKTGETATIQCSHSIEGYNQMLWYKNVEVQMQFLGYMSYSNALPEKGVDVEIKGSASVNEQCQLIIPKLNLNSSALYYCAARTSNAEAYFGPGTRLTVLGETPKQVNPPKVTLLKPSPQECSQQKKKKKKTLVCVATGFYPDHVSVVWQVNQVEEHTGVATDSRALRSGDYYSISSRLRVPSSQWFNSHTTFKCVVNFFNGKESVAYEAEMKGEKGWDQEDAMTRDNFLKIWQSAKLSYAVLIAKSCVYAAFLFFLLRNIPLGFLGEK
ncbi:M1-specific T cell receptor beta chain-like [Nerophis lumbriciformis]|uniref:M1-specific T cell receptor beta chain-like n=1 Tax=Nerophis lumbriciformis TaxID=546530 RepID=UPI003BAD15C7